MRKCENLVDLEKPEKNEYFVVFSLDAKIGVNSAENESSKVSLADSEGCSAEVAAAKRQGRAPNPDPSNRDPNYLLRAELPHSAWFQALRSFVRRAGSH